MNFKVILTALIGFLVSAVFTLPTVGQSGNTELSVNNAYTNHALPDSTTANTTANTTALAARNDLFTITLCDGPNRSGICTDLQMQNNFCQGTPILVNTVSVYIPDQTKCQVYTNIDCEVGNGNIVIIVNKSYADFRTFIRNSGGNIPLMSWVCHNSIGE